MGHPQDRGRDGRFRRGMEDSTAVRFWAMSRGWSMRWNTGGQHQAERYAGNSRGELYAESMGCLGSRGMTIQSTM